LEQILHNLLTNAIRYSPEGSGLIEASLQEKDDGCVIAIKDNGIGIPSADKPHVFDRFYRANNAINTEQHGTGLGLYYVQLVTSLLGGKVWFRSSQGKGTTFYVRVPKC
jgi:signal transduction histidine kinase